MNLLYISVKPSIERNYLNIVKKIHILEDILSIV